MTCAIKGQKTPSVYYNLERMLSSAASKGVGIGCCGSCLDARGLTDDRLAGGASRSSMDELTDWTIWADKVITF